ncbi:MAG: UDP-N-acetylglucosamine 1-carboxyvinyltransferase [Candidatus Moraniibacteriota bacterium]|nr:MAG: UDP-N-acetylglucosamine 1-carboxyvinyltransferase [Candidatus Moranbacteria bacterium]
MKKKLEIADIRQQFVIEGGKKLTGTIDVRGSKNATAPILAATILTKEECILKNVPHIEDVVALSEILKSMGARVVWIDRHTLSVCCKKLYPEKIDISLVKKIRLSILLLGSLSVRFDAFKLYHPGGCKIGIRPVGTHFDALLKMGVDVRQKDNIYFIDASKKHAENITLREFSPTATENIMMLAASIEGKTRIKIAAAEPHVEDLGRFLQKMGAKIKGLGTHTLEIEGQKTLKGAQHTIIADANEAATFLILGAATKSDIVVTNAREEHLDLVLEKMREFGVSFEIRKNSIRVIPARKLKSVAKIDARIYPGVPTDVQAPFGVLATQAEGTTMIHDTLFEGRFNYVGELQKMGANAHILNPHQAVFTGPTQLLGTSINSFDLRAGAALIIAALIAKGKTIVRDAYQVDRGYEQIEERLRGIGANIERQWES